MTSGFYWYVCSINSPHSFWANTCCSVTHPFKCSGQLPWQPAQTGDEIRAGAVALRESLSICLLTPPSNPPLHSVCVWRRLPAIEAAHKQQRWLTPAPSPRADHHRAELTEPPINAESDRMMEIMSTSRRFSLLDFSLCFHQIWGSLT